MKLIQILDHAVNGYWDGGPKSRFEWTIQGQVQRDEKGEYVKIGSWEANHWFHVSVGKTERDTLRNAFGYIARRYQKRGFSPGKFTIE